MIYCLVVCDVVNHETSQSVAEKNQLQPTHRHIMLEAIMASSSLSILKDTPDDFSNVLCKLRVFHDLCFCSSGVHILGPEVETKIGQCSVDFRHVSIQTARLAERVESNWCGTCIIFFENFTKIKNDPSKVMYCMSNQAKELSTGFGIIAEWIRKLAGRFHDCQELSGKDKEKYIAKQAAGLQWLEKTETAKVNS